MDHYGLLGVARQLTLACNEVHIKRNSLVCDWEWAGTPVLYPETHCPFCLQVVRSNGIWFFSGTNQDRLVGVIMLDQPTVKMVFPSHPHDTGGGYLCFGKYGNKTGIELLASTPNIGDSPRGAWRIPMWLKQYWNGHVCQAGKDWLANNGYRSEFRELERPLIP
jgi:hypothetical protein